MNTNIINSIKDYMYPKPQCIKQPGTYTDEDIEKIQKFWMGRYSVLFWIAKYTLWDRTVNPTWFLASLTALPMIWEGIKSLGLGLLQFIVGLVLIPLLLVWMVPRAVWMLLFGRIMRNGRADTNTIIQDVHMRMWPSVYGLERKQDPRSAWSVTFYDDATGKPIKTMDLGYCENPDVALKYARLKVNTMSGYELVPAHYVANTETHSVELAVCRQQQTQE